MESGAQGGGGGGYDSSSRVFTCLSHAVSPPQLADPMPHMLRGRGEREGGEGRQAGFEEDRQEGGLASLSCGVLYDFLCVALDLGLVVLRE